MDAPPLLATFWGSKNTKIGPWYDGMRRWVRSLSLQRVATSPAPSSWLRLRLFWRRDDLLTRRLPLKTTGGARSASVGRWCAGQLASHTASTVRGCGASATSPSDLGDATASSQGGSPIKTTGGAPLRIGRSPVCRPVGLTTVRGCGASATSPSDLGDATASSQGGSPIKTTGGTPLRIGRSPVCRPVGLAHGLDPSSQGGSPIKTRVAAPFWPATQRHPPATGPIRLAKGFPGRTGAARPFSFIARPALVRMALAPVARHVYSG
ncbi:hypothetical protein BC826DRAFT_1113713 [Russula brevipes]|nr:hypothetical protein BC826DRAFT_1113713 [Russula brevipes]